MVDREDPSIPLEPSAGQMRALGEAATELLVRYVEGLPAMAASDSEGARELAAGFREPAPEQGQPLGPLLERLERAARKGFGTAGPGYLAYIPAGGLFTAALAEYLACGINKYVTVWSAAPALAQIETTVIRWLADLFGYPAGARGLLTTGGSMSIFSALVTARRARLPEEFLKGTLYVSDQAHASVAKAAMLAGFPRGRVRVVPSTGALRMDVPALRRMVREDRQGGLQPFCVVASAGTTNTGAVDDLPACADVAAEEGLWLHVDGAYGGFFQLTARGRERLRGIERADSITLDPHKGLFLPYGSGCLLVREGARLKEAHALGAEYLQDLAPEEEIPSFTDYSPELSRGFRGLRVWLPLMAHGLGAFRAALEEKLELAEVIHRGLKDAPGFEVPWAPELTVVAFRYRPARGDPEAFNRRLLERINASRRVFLSSTTIRGKLVLRACVLSVRTHRDRVTEAVEIIRRAAAELEREG